MDKLRHTVVEVARQVYEKGQEQKAVGVKEIVFSWFCQGFHFVVIDSGFTESHPFTISWKKNDTLFKVREMGWC